MKLLFVASDEMEFRGVRRGDDQRRFVSNGAGPGRAAAAVDAALASFHPDAIVSMGFCGALDPPSGSPVSWWAPPFSRTAAPSPRNRR